MAVRAFHAGERLTVAGESGRTNAQAPRTGADRSAEPNRAPASVLIVKLSSLGDVVHAMPVVHDLRTAFPGVVVDWVAEPAFAPLIGRVQGVRQVIPCAQRRWRLAWWTAATRAEWRAFRNALRVEHYGAVLDLQGLTKSALIARLARGRSHGLANRTDGASHEPPARWLVHDAIRIAQHTHAVDRSRELVARALGYAFTGPPVFGLAAGAAPRTSSKAPDVRPTVAFVHGTSRADKLWPDDHWLALGRRCAAAGWHIALPQSGASEAERAARWAAAWRADGIACSVWPECNLSDMVDRLAATQGVIGVDSGLSHIAVALGLSHVQIYNLPTAWRTGPQEQRPHTPHSLPPEGAARPRQVAVEASPAPSVDAVWAAWQSVVA